MSTPFYLSGNTMTIVAGATATNIEVPPGDTGNPNVVYIISNDPTNTAAVNVGFGSVANAVMPSSGTSADGIGVLIPSKGSALIRLDSTYQSGNLVVSAVSDGTVRIFVTPGVL